MHNSDFILASGSPRRKDLLEKFIPNFKIVIPNVEEIEDADFALFLPVDNAILKGKIIAEKHPDSLVLSADTIVVYDNLILGKPKDLNHAKEILLKLNGKTHQVITGVSLINISKNYYQTFADVSDVTFNKLSDEEIEKYLTLINPLDKAGAYAAQEYTDFLIKEIKGSLNNVIGLPTEKLKEILKNGARKGIWNSDFHDIN